MARESLVTAIVDRLLEDIVSGALPAGSPLPPEAELATRFQVNRLTLREAIRTLAAQEVILVAPGKRSVVNPVSDWTDIGAVVRAVSADADRDAVSIQLVQVRRLIETGAAELAAPLCTDADLDRLDDCLARMRAAQAEKDVPAFVRADIEFHDVILRASGNVFLGVLLEPLGRVLYERRFETSAVPEVQEHAIRRHSDIADAMRSRDARAAREAMERHIDQTAEDLAEFVIGASSGAGGSRGEGATA